MTITLRIALIVVSVLTCAWVILSIRKARAKIEDTVFWILFSGLLMLLSLFPQIAEFGAYFLGVQSQTNFLFLTILYVLIIKVFRMSIKISILESKLTQLAQRIAVDKMIEKK